MEDTRKVSYHQCASKYDPSELVRRTDRTLETRVVSDQADFWDRAPDYAYLKA